MAMKWLLGLLLCCGGCAPSLQTRLDHVVTQLAYHAGWMPQPYPGCAPVFYESEGYEFDGETFYMETGLSYACPH